MALYLAYCDETDYYNDPFEGIGCNSVQYSSPDELGLTANTGAQATPLPALGTDDYHYLVNSVLLLFVIAFVGSMILRQFKAR